jgi:hypothetical protein
VKTSPLWTLGLVSLLAVPAQASSINCPKAPGGACGQCEPDLLGQMDDLMKKADNGDFHSAADFLAAVPLEIRSNAVVVADSKSRQKATLKPGGAPDKTQLSPRMIWKSPNAELFISFNTDPAAPGYEKIEIQRWDGKTGKFVYQEISFPDEKPTADGKAAPPPGPGGHHAHVSYDASKDCVQCHRHDPRPNFDSYQTWAGFVPPRDDVLEKGKDGKPDPNTQLWFSFMNQVVAAKKTVPPPNRLSSIVVPYPGNMSDEDKLKEIQRVVDQGPGIGTANSTNEDTRTLYGYRIPHTPNKGSGQLKNTSGKTFADAGFGHTTFDQLLNLQMCHVATGLKARPDFNKIKYAMAAVMSGCASPSEIAGYLPPAYQRQANQYFVSQGLHSSDGKPVTSSAIALDVFDDTANNEKQLDQQKQKRHTEFLKQVGAPDPETYGKKLVSVGDTGTAQIASMRYLLEPLGVKVGDWSMSFGDDLAHPSYTFADQFEILGQQDMFEDLRKQYEAEGNGADMCAWFKSQSKQAFAGTLKPYVPPRPKTAAELIAQCQSMGKDSAPAAGAAGDGYYASANYLRPQAQQVLRDCLDCHDSASMVNGKLKAGTNVFDVANLKTWLSSKRAGGNQTWFERIVAATGHTGPIQMPPGEELRAEDRDALLGYFASVMSSSDGKGTGFKCEALPARDIKKIQEDCPDCEKHGGAHAKAAE